MLERIRNKLNAFADKRYKAFILKSMHVKDEKKLCLAEHARIELITEGLYSSEIGSSVTLWPDVKISLCGGGVKKPAL